MVKVKVCKGFRKTGNDMGGKKIVKVSHLEKKELVRKDNRSD